MTRENFAVQVRILKEAYREKIMATPGGEEVWFDFFKGFDEEVFSEAVRRQVTRCNDAPTIAKMINRCESIRDGKRDWGF